MKNLHIMICDDDPLDLEKTTQMVKEYDVSGQLQISACLQAKELLNSDTSPSYDIVLLDIEMESPNGYDVAKQLVAKADPPVIIFVTQSSEYTLKGYGIALRYLQKPLSKTEFDEAMDAAIQEASAHKLCFISEDMTVGIPFREILYIEMFGHYAVIHASTAEYRIRSTLKEIQSKLPQGYFANPHKSILVNLEHVRCASNSQIILDNGGTVPISRRRQQEFNISFYRFLER